MPMTLTVTYTVIVHRMIETHTVFNFIAREKFQSGPLSQLQRLTGHSDV